MLHMSPTTDLYRILCRYEIKTKSTNMLNPNRKLNSQTQNWEHENIEININSGSFSTKTTAILKKAFLHRSSSLVSKILEEKGKRENRIPKKEK